MRGNWPRAVAVALVLLTGACRRSQSGREPGTRADLPHPDAEVVLKKGTGLTGGWLDQSLSPSSVDAGEPASVDLSGKKAWILGKPTGGTELGGLRIRLHSPPELGDFLEIRVDSRSTVIFPRVVVGPQHRRDLEDGWTEIWIPLAELNPDRAPFDRLVIRARQNLRRGTRVRFEEIAFTAREMEPDDAGSDETVVRAAPDVKMAVDCLLPGHAISPLIYGIAFKPSHDERDTHQWRLGAAARRWGGNPTSRYNWRLGNAWNTASDWFFRNVNYTKDERYTYERFLEDDIAYGMATALTVPTLGWVAKDTESVAFPVSVFGPQQQVAPEDPRVGNGVGRDGKPKLPGPPTMTSVAAPPEFIEQWVRAIRQADARRGRSVQMYILDNEPALWNTTHRDVHPDPVTYDELLDRTIRYGGAVRKADPEATIAGPAEWGWPGYFFSAKDQAAGFYLRPDRLAHGNKPLLPWLLSELRRHREETGERILDVVDVHYYPQADGVGIGTEGKVDAFTAALRIRSTRSLWDPAYVDESWINDTVRLIPRLKRWIAETDPGLGISIGEWNFGAEGHMSGGLAAAETLGRFATEGITSAFYWDYPPDESPAFWAFRAFRNYDGKGGRFMDWLVPATTAYPLSSVFASRNRSGDRMVLVLLNLDPQGPLDAHIDLGSCGMVLGSKAYSYAGGTEGLVEVAADPRGKVGTLEQRLETYSMTVLEVQLKPPTGRALPAAPP